jgi:hypothetical protein
MKAIIENGKISDGIQSCFISEYGVGIVFHNIDDETLDIRAEW